MTAAEALNAPNIAEDIVEPSVGALQKLLALDDDAIRSLLARTAFEGSARDDDVRSRLCHCCEKQDDHPS